MKKRSTNTQKGVTRIDYLVAGCATVAVAAGMILWLVPTMQDRLNTWPPSAEATLRRCREAVKSEAQKIQWRPYWKHVRDEPTPYGQNSNTRIVKVFYRAQDNANGDLYETVAYCTLRPNKTEVLLMDEVRDFLLK